MTLQNKAPSAGKVYLEVAIKNLAVLLTFGIFLLPQISYEFEVIEGSQQGGVLSMLGFLMAGGIIGAFELSYAKTKLASKLQRYLADTKFLLYLAICVLVWIGYKTTAISGAIIMTGFSLLGFLLFAHYLFLILGILCLRLISNCRCYFSSI